MHKDFCIISELPEFINTKVENERHLGHMDGAPYIRWSDGSGIYALNGVRVPRWLAETPSEELDPEDYNKIENADVRLEFLKKIGFEKMKHLGESLDTYNSYSDPFWILSEYELIDMNCTFEGIDYAPHLWMKNLTTGDFHLEPVHPSCRTLPDALRFRYGNKDVKLFAVK